MKKLLSAILAVCIAFSFAALTVSAETAESAVASNQQIEYLEDGGYIIVTVEEDASPRATTSKTGKKTFDCYNDDDEKIWTAVVTGTFTYTGSSATCTSSSTSYTIHNTSWHHYSSSASKSSNKAIGDFVFKKRVLGITIQTLQKTVTLTCSATGSLS